jgi:UDP-sulfoquinovose synthase
MSIFKCSLSKGVWLKVLICGMDGYIGWGLALRLSELGHEVHGIDNFSRRSAVEEVNSWSATPILTMVERLEAAKKIHGFNIHFTKGDLMDYDQISNALKSARPDGIVQLAEQPSAPYSMIDRKHAFFTQENNVLGTLNLLFAMKDHAPNAQLVKLGTMGEYGTPNLDIPEGFFEVEYRGRKDYLPFPRQAGSFYHLSKVHDSANIALACKLWGLRSTDIMQGVVYGTRTLEITEDPLLTRFDFDEVFGTAINRFCAQAVIGYPLSPYGKGEQKRGFIALVDSIQCLSLALENPPNEGEYRVFNQLDEVYGINELAEHVKKVGNKLGLAVEIKNVENLRVEKEEHHYKVDHEHLRKLGFKPTRPLDDEIRIMLGDLMRFRSRIDEKREVIRPLTSWRKGRRMDSIELLDHKK